MIKCFIYNLILSELGFFFFTLHDSSNLIKINKVDFAAHGFHFPVNLFLTLNHLGIFTNFQMT